MTDQPDEPKDGTDDEDFESADGLVDEVPKGSEPGSDVGMHEMSMPPPLPRRRPPKWVMAIGLLIVIVAAGLGLFLGDAITGSPEAAPAATPELAATTEEAEAPSGEPAEVAPTRIELGTIVIGAEEEPIEADEPSPDPAP